MATKDPVCPLCGRPIPPGVPQSSHHLMPRLKGGARGPVVRLHQICHNAIHVVLTEAEIARGYRDVAALRANPPVNLESEKHNIDSELSALEALSKSV